MPSVAALKDIVDGLQQQDDNFTAYLDRRTGEVIVVSNEDFREIEGDEGEIDIRRPARSALEEAYRAAMRAIADGDRNYLKLPSRFEINEYWMMRQFAALHSDEEDLERALHRSGAFRRFKHAVHRLGLAEQWYAYRDREYEQIATTWCREHDIELR